MAIDPCCGYMDIKWGGYLVTGNFICGSAATIWYGAKGATTEIDLASVLLGVLMFCMYLSTFIGIYMEKVQLVWVGVIWTGILVIIVIMTPVGVYLYSGYYDWNSNLSPLIFLTVCLTYFWIVLYSLYKEMTSIDEERNQLIPRDDRGSGILQDSVRQDDSGQSPVNNVHFHEPQILFYQQLHHHQYS